MVSELDILEDLTNHSPIILKFTFRIAPESIDYLVALLAELPFDAFEELDDGLVTAIHESQWNQEHQNFLDDLKESVPFLYSLERQEPKNWNEIWESEFKEIVIDDFCIIRAPFHAPSMNCNYEIVIEPRMAFGTGHHETTRLMIRSMRLIDFKEKKVLDFGSGSGVLAILAAKMGASSVCAIENDEQAFVNLKENIEFNRQQNIVGECKDHLLDFSDGSFDIVLANITRNVLIDHVEQLERILVREGILIVSGFLKKDLEVIVNTFIESGLEVGSRLEENDWIAHTFIK